MRIVYASVETFTMLLVVTFPIRAIDPTVWAWYTLCVVLGFVLRLGMEHKKHLLTRASVLYQSICTVTWCFFMSLVWHTFLNYEKGLEIYLFINSLFAAFMVSQFEEIFEMGFKQWLRIKVGKFLAIEVKENKP